MKPTHATIPVMKSLITLGLVCFGTTAYADKLHDLSKSIEDAWQKNQDGVWILVDGPTESGLKPPACEVLLGELATEKTPDTATFQLQSESRDLKAGTHTVAEGRPACAQIAYWAKVKKFRSEALQARKFNDLEMSKRCIDAYNDVTKAGVKPTEVIPPSRVYIDGKEEVFTGSIESVRIKYCDAMYKKYQAEQAKREAPYRKVLKADKLDAALSGRFWMLPGGVEGANDPAKLAAASVWFYTMTPADGSGGCTNDPKIMLYRWQFDAKQKLVKTTEKSFCGDPPKTAYK